MKPLSKLHQEAIIKAQNETDQNKAAAMAMHDHTKRAVSETHKWVGLNWDDLPEIYVGDTAFLHGAKWAEAKLREKNSL